MSATTGPTTPQNRNDDLSPGRLNLGSAWKRVARRAFYVGMLVMGVYIMFQGIPAESGQPVQECFGYSCSDMLNICLTIWTFCATGLFIAIMRRALRQPMYTLRYTVGILLSLRIFSILFDPKLFRHWGPLAVDVGVLFGMFIQHLFSFFTQLLKELLHPSTHTYQSIGNATNEGEDVHTRNGDAV